MFMLGLQLVFSNPNFNLHLCAQVVKLSSQNRFLLSTQIEINYIILILTSCDVAVNHTRHQPIPHGEQVPIPRYPIAELFALGIAYLLRLACDTCWWARNDPKIRGVDTSPSFGLVEGASIETKDVRICRSLWLVTTRLDSATH